jgi:aminoglycoside phosphotransferase (APT) family kinase protein
MPCFIVIPPEDIARARALYETTSVPVHDIAKMLGIGTTTFMKRVKLWKWRPRNRRLAELDAAAKAEVPVEEIRKIAEEQMIVLSQASLIERIRSAVEREIVAIENVLAAAESARLRSPDAERAARSLSALVKTLREVNTLEKAGAENDEPEKDQFRDLDDFRRELVARLDRLRAAGDSG